ncbi:MAG TPA: hypothetical protein VM243_02370 [Phycisphaerae bacterium]|nr:hypothetical protein [Phycisphaerae bacterium]
MFGMAEITVVCSLLAAAAALPTIYIVCLIVGGGLVAISTIFGHHADMDVDTSLDADLGVDFHADMDTDIAPDVDVGADVDVGPEVEVHAEAEAAHVDHAGEGISLASWFSIRFLVYFTATFGAIGTVLTFLTPMGTGAVLLIAIGSGLIVGQGVHQTLRYLQRTSGDSAATVRDYVNRPARVTIAIAEGERGEIALQVRGQERFVAATAKRGEDHFKIGDRVAVVTFANGTAEVVSEEEYDFVHEHEGRTDS